MTSEAFQDEAVILEVRNWQTADKYAVCFCRHHGKVPFIAYGAAYPKSTSGRIDQPFAQLGVPLMRELVRVRMLRVGDEYWMDFIDAMQELRQGIGLRADGQNDPVVAYKKEGYEMFESMIAAIQAETIRRIFLARVPVGATTVTRERVAKVTGESAGSDGTVKKQPVKKGQKVGRNDPCPCGSGKKYKKCCGMHEDE